VLDKPRSDSMDQAAKEGWPAWRTAEQRAHSRTTEAVSDDGEVLRVKRDAGRVLGELGIGGGRVGLIVGDVEGVGTRVGVLEGGPAAGERTANGKIATIGDVITAR